MPAIIESTLYDAPPPGGLVVAGSTQQNSRDDLRLGYHVVLQSVDVATTYSWTLAFASDSPGTVVPGTPFDGTDSISALLAPEGSTSSSAKFNVDYEGTYLIRLTVDAGLPTESTQFIRARVLTLFGSLKLIAAGERRDEKGVIPVDATAEGWANDQNANMQRIGLLLRRLSHSGRVLFVDSNRGRDTTKAQDDYTNVIAIPGPDTARPEATGLKLRAMAHGDFSSISAAIAYAAAAAARGEPAPSATEPYFIVVRKGLYLEDLNLTSFVHIIGDDATFFDTGVASTTQAGVIVRTVNSGGTGTHQYNPLVTYTTDECFLFNLRLEGTANITVPVIDQLGGLLKLYGCEVIQKGDAANQGEAVRVVVANVANAPALWVERSSIGSKATTADRVALRFDGVNGYCNLWDTKVLAPACQGVVVNESLATLCEFHAQARSLIDADVGYVGYASKQTFEDSEVVTSNVLAIAINVSPFGGGVGSKLGDVLVDVERSALTGTISFATKGAVGTTTLTTAGVTSRTGIGSPHILLPDAPGDMPDTFNTTLDSESLRYEPAHVDPLKGPGGAATINVANQLGKGNVQEALDILVQAVLPVIGSPFYSLHSAYSGLATLSPPTLGTGLGRTIVANGGAVQITGGTAPFSLDDQLKYGGLQTEGVIDIGGLINGAGTLVDVGHSEIHLNPNMMGAGPFIALGRTAWTNGITGGNRGFGGAVIIADSATAPATPVLTPFNLHLRTTYGQGSSTGQLGNIYIAAGGINDPTNPNHPGEVHINGGFNHNAAGTSGDVYLAPGDFSGGAGFGKVWFAGTNGSEATLTAAGAYLGAQAGIIYIGTPNGVEQFTFTGAENIAAAVAVFNATARGFMAKSAAGVITLVGPPSPASDIVYVGDSVGGALNTALGDLAPATATFTAGVYGDIIALNVPQNGRLRVNGDLEVTGTVISVNGYKAVTDADSPYTTLITEKIFGAQIVAADIAIILNAGYLTGDRVVIKDENGLAAAGQKISISDQAGGFFDGVTPLNITTSYGAVTLYKNSASNWSVI